MPVITSIKISERVINLIMRFYNSLLMIFEVGPEKFSPTFYIHEVEGKTCTIVHEWCSGFLPGIALASDTWQPLLDEKPGILRPFQLFATPAGWAELDAAALHAAWSSKIEPTVHALHAYWLPYREEVGNTPTSRHPKRTAGKPKVGRNVPCPCGSGKKYKHCCGR
jgi:yecA family protein